MPLRIRTVRQTVLDELAAAGLPSDPKDVDCRFEDARLTVTLPRPTAADAADRITAALGRYTFAWSFTEA